MPQFSDFMVYVDESGDHSLTSIDKSYPIFALAFCVFYTKPMKYSIIAIWKNQTQNTA